MVEPRPERDEESKSAGAGRESRRVVVHRDFGTKLHETIVQLIAIAMTAMYVMWTALISVNTVAFQCGAIPECRDGRWYAGFFSASFFVDHPGRRVTVGLLLPLALLGLFMYLGRSSRVRYDEFGARKSDQPDSSEDVRFSADTVAQTRTAIGRTSFWFPGAWQKPTGHLHVAVTLLIIAGLLGRAVGRFEEAFKVEVAHGGLGAWIFWLSVATAAVAVIALAAATFRSEPLLGNGVKWFESLSPVVSVMAAALVAAALALVWQLDAPDAALVSSGGSGPAVPITDFWGFGWAPVILLVLSIALVGGFSVVQIARWIEWHFIHFDQILVAAMLLLVVLWPVAIWVAAISAAVAIVADLLDRLRPGRKAAEDGDRTKKAWRLLVFAGFMAATLLLRLISADWAAPFGIGWPRVTPIVFFTAGLTLLSLIQVNGHLNAAGTTRRPWTVQVALPAVPAGIVVIGWSLTATLHREEWLYGAIVLAWCVAAVVWLAQFEHSRWRWNGPGAVALLGLAIVMGAFSGLMIWLVDLLDGDRSQFMLRATAVYQ
ncbi:MAG: hypothetical protein WB239_06590, partial [Acidimicrobiia bacterium]